MLTGKEIKRQVSLGNITIEPFDERSVGPNSYDLRVGNEFAKILENTGRFIDLGQPSSVDIHKCETERYFTLYPGEAYLAHTIEVIGSKEFVPIIHGRSSAARHGLMVHYAGLGDLGWSGQVVLELVNMTNRVMLLPVGVRIAQVSWHLAEGEVGELYNSTYQGQRGVVSAKGLT